MPCVRTTSSGIMCRYCGRLLLSPRIITLVAVIMAVPVTAFMLNWKPSSLKCARAGSCINVCPGQHDDLGISCAMLNCATRHPHLNYWMGPVVAARWPNPRRQTFGWAAFT